MTTNFPCRFEGWGRERRYENKTHQKRDNKNQQVARAWSELEERKRILGMKPKPKDVDVAALQAAKAKRNAPAQGFTETPVEKGKTPQEHHKPGSDKRAERIS